MADAFVARWFPKKHQLVIGTLAMYTGLYGLYRMVKGNPKPQTIQQQNKQRAEANAPVAATGPTAASEGGYQGPTINTFDQWASNPDNLKQWEQWASTPGNIEKWEKTLQ